MITPEAWTPVIINNIYIFIYIFIIYTMNTATAYQDRNFVQLFGVSGYSRTIGMSYFVPNNVNIIVLKAGKG